jgi:predicted permease
MLSVFLLAAKQLLQLLIIGLIGFGLRKGHVIRDSDQGCFSWLLMKLAIPCMILYSFQTNTQDGLEKNLPPLALWLAVLILISLGAGWLMANLMKTPPHQRGALYFGYMFTNGGGLGMVLFMALYTGPILIYTAILMFLANLAQATLGAGIMNRYSSERMHTNPWKVAFTNPPALAGLLGCILMVLDIQLPDLCINLLETLQNMTAPLSMLLVGACLADSNPREYLRNKSLYVYSLFRLILLPLIAFGLFYFLPVDRYVAITLILVTAMPCALNISAYAEQCKNDTLYASQLVFLSTLLSVVTIPFFVVLVEYL